MEVNEKRCAGAGFIFLMISSVVLGGEGALGSAAFGASCAAGAAGGEVSIWAKGGAAFSSTSIEVGALVGASFVWSTAALASAAAIESAEKGPVV